MSRRARRFDFFFAPLCGDSTWREFGRPRTDAIAKVAAISRGARHLRMIHSGGCLLGGIEAGISIPRATVRTPYVKLIPETMTGEEMSVIKAAARLIIPVVVLCDDIAGQSSPTPRAGSISGSRKGRRGDKRRRELTRPRSQLDAGISICLGRQKHVEPSEYRAGSVGIRLECS